MSNQVLLCPGAGATSSKLTSVYAAIDIAKARNFAGIRIDVGTNNYGNLATGDTATMILVAARALLGVGALSKIRWVMGINPKFDGVAIIAANGGVRVAVPNLPTSAGVKAWLVTWWQKCVDDMRAWAIANSLDPTEVFEWEWINELCIGGNNSMYDVGTDPLNTATYGKSIGYITYPVGTYPNGAIPPVAIQTVDEIQLAVNWHGMTTIGWNFEGETAREITDFTGSHAVSIVASCDKLGTNMYANAPALPFSSVVFKASFGTKIENKRAACAANPVIDTKLVDLTEFGLDRRRAPNCQHANTLRQFTVDYVESAATGIEGGCFYCAVNPGGAITSNQYLFYAYEDNGTPLGGIAVEVP